MSLFTPCLQKPESYSRLNTALYCTLRLTPHNALYTFPPVSVYLTKCAVEKSREKTQDHVTVPHVAVVTCLFKYRGVYLNIV